MSKSKASADPFKRHSTRHRGITYALGYRRGLEAALRALVLVHPDAPGAWESPPAGRQPDGSYLVY